MKPLRHTREFSSESERRVAELLATLDPYKPNPARKPNFGVKLANARQRWGLRVLRPAAGLALLFAGTAAAATLGERFWSEPVDEAPPQIPLARSTAPEAPRGTPRSVHRAAPQADLEDRTHAGDTPPVITAPKRTNVPPARAVSNTKRQQARPSEDPGPVVEALRALRKEQDPARAQSLLTEYLAQNPQGALSEEALALSIEAAHARKDPAAKQHARRYLARYPAGRHRRLAERALAE